MSTFVYMPLLSMFKCPLAQAASSGYILVDCRTSDAARNHLGGAARKGAAASGTHLRRKGGEGVGVFY